jgi:hypothetical protein
MRQTITTIAAVVAAIACVVTAFSMIAWFKIFDLTASSDAAGDLMQQVGCKSYVGFVLDRAEAGMKPAEIQRLWNEHIARGVSSSTRFDEPSGPCGSIADIAAFAAK